MSDVARIVGDLLAIVRVTMPEDLFATDARIERAQALLARLRGRRIHSPRPADVARGVRVDRGPQRAQLMRAMAVLTPREQEVLVLVVAGKTSKEVGDILGIGLSTAAGTRNRVLKKLGAKNTAELIRVTLLSDTAQS